MTNLARKLEDNSVFQEYGVVERVEATHATVATPRGVWRAKRAASCLLAPERGDEVLLAFGGERGCWVLAVLERSPGSPARIEVEGDLALSLPRGRFTVAAQEGVDLVSAGEVAVTSSTVRVSAAQGTVAIDALAYVGRHVQAEVERVKAIVGNLDTVADRVWQRVKRSYRFVEETDQVRAERIDYEARGTINLHGENAVVTAEKLVKADGEQIHLG